MFEQPDAFITHLVDTVLADTDDTADGDGTGLARPVITDTCLAKPPRTCRSL